MRGGNEECIHEIFACRAGENPAAIALTDGDRVFSYLQLETLSNAFAGQLRQRGVGCGDVVALLMSRSAEMFVAMLGILKCGAAYMPLDRGNPDARNRYCLEKARCRLIIADSACDELCSDDRVVCRCAIQELVGKDPGGPEVRFSTETPAYVMYTSGTTADPKGVVVPHRAVVRLVMDTNYIKITPDDSILQF